MYSSDVEWLKKQWEYGYTEVIRDEVRAFVTEFKKDLAKAKKNPPFGGNF